MHIRLFVGLIGCYVVTGQMTISVPAAGNCGDDTVLICRYDASITCTSWRFRKGNVELVGNNNPTTSKYLGSADSAQRTVTLTIKNMEITDEGSYRCYCGFSGNEEGYLPFECKPTTVIKKIREDKKLEVNFNQVYPNPTSVSVTVNSNFQPGTHTCTGSTSTSYSCTWTSSSSLEDVDGGYRVVVKTITETPLSGSIKIATPDPPNVSNREQLPGGRNVIRATEDNQVNLTCLSSGGIPAPTVAWYRNSIGTSPLKSISIGQNQGDGTYRVTLTHTITARRSDDLKTFVCRSLYPQATSTVTQGSRETSVQMYLNLKPDKPTITQTNTPVSGGTVTLECRTSGGRPAPTVTWTYRGQTFSSEVQSEKDVSTETYSVVSTLQRPVTVADNGEPATCRVSHMASERTTNIDVAVIFPVSPSSTVITGNREIEATGSNPVNLNCTTGSSNPASTITWRKGSTVITNSNLVNSWTGTNRGKVTSQILTLRPTRYDDGEVITCSVTNSDSDVAASQGGAVTKSVILNLRYSPEIQPMTGITVDEGQVDVVLSCIVSSKPVSTITWSRGGSSPVQGQGTATGNGYNNFNYTLTTVTRDDQGTYRCKADNKIGSADSKDVTVTVRYLTVTTTNTTSDSARAVITCTLNNFGGSYEAQPWVQKWQQSNGEYVEVNSRPFIPILNLTQLTYEYSGVYICMVKAGESGAIYVQGNETLLVKSPPIILEPKVHNTRYKVAGRMNRNSTVSLQYYSNVYGSDVKCYRTTNGIRSPTPFGTILLSEITVQLPVFSHIVPTAGTKATVTIVVHSNADFGDYDIVITNGIGSGSILQISVIPQGPPDAPNSLRVVSYSPHSATVEWVPGYHGGLDQTFVIQLSQEGVTWFNKTSVYGGQVLTTTVSTTMEDLAASTNYYIRMFAYNSEGLSDGYSTVLNFTTSKMPVTSSECSLTYGHLASGMFGTLVLGLVVGVVLILLLHWYQILNISVRGTDSNDSSGPMKLFKKKTKPKSGQHYQDTSFSAHIDTEESMPTEYTPGTYEDLKSTQTDNNYDSLQTATTSDETYYNLKI